MYTILYYTILYYTMLCYAILYYTTLHYTILYSTILYYTILYITYYILYIIYYNIILYCIIWYDILYCIIWYDIISYHIMLYYLIWYYIVWYDMIWYYIRVYCNVQHYTIDMLYYIVELLSCNYSAILQYFDTFHQTCKHAHLDAHVSHFQSFVIERVVWQAIPALVSMLSQGLPSDFHWFSCIFHGRCNRVLA